MIQNELLKEKYNVQESIALDVNYNTQFFAAKVHDKIKEIELARNVKIKYAKIDYVKSAEMEDLSHTIPQPMLAEKHAKYNTKSGEK